MDSLNTLAVNTIGPVVDFLESLSWIGVNTHFVKHAVVVRTTFALCLLLIHVLKDNTLCVRC